jgi:aminomethyltransferase
MNKVLKNSTMRQTPVQVPRGLVPTPFHARLEPANITQDWMGWSGFLSARKFQSVESEYFAIRNQSTLFDLSPMHKYRIEGPDALTVVNRLLTRDVRKLKDNRVGYAVWCDEDGSTIDDGTIFRFTDTHFRLCCQEPQYTWLCDVAWGFDVTLTDESETVVGLSMQGPTSYSVLKAAGFEGTEGMKPFDIQHFDDDIMISRTGFTGDLGYELWADSENALPLYDRLMSAGRNLGLRPIGYDALNMARIEAGFMVTGVEFQSIHHALRPTRGRTPFDLGLDRLVHFDKGHFNGRRALLKAKETGPRYALVALEIDGNKPAHQALVYHKGKTEAGLITSALWSPICKRNLALAMLKAPFGIDITTDLKVEIYHDKEGKYDRAMVPAKIADRPFFNNPRRAATPPALC